MQLQIASDLHLEFPENKYFLKDNPLKVAGDILLLAGDILTLKNIEWYSDFLNFVSDNYSHTYWVPGNHEYYNFDMANRAGSFKEAIRSNVTLLNNQSVVLGDVNLHFSTLWSNIFSSAWEIKNSLSDFHVIKYQGSRLTIDQYNSMHAAAMRFLEGALFNKSADENSKQKNIVVTHHVPTFQHYPPQYLGSALNEAFATDLDEFIIASAADYWIYGHHHSNTDDFKIGETTLVTNQFGYVQANEHKTFNPGKNIVLD